MHFFNVFLFFRNFDVFLDIFLFLQIFDVFSDVFFWKNNKTHSIKINTIKITRILLTLY